MKYIAVFEVPDGEDVSEGAVLMAGVKTYGADVKEAPHPMEISLCGELGYKDTQTTKHIKEGYNQALRDCGVSE